MGINLDNVKAGYLIRCTVMKETNGMNVGDQFNATIMPCIGNCGEIGALYACTQDGFSARLNGVCFNKRNSLKVEPYFRIDELWGLSLPFGALESETSGRKLLWQRAKKMTLKEAENALGYCIKVVDGSEELEKKKRPFGKSNLEPGMVAEDRAGTKWLVTPSEEGLLLVCGGVSCYLSSYRDDLTIYDKQRTDFDIVTVWGRIKTRGSVCDAFTTNTDNRGFIWQRDERRPMTREKIEKALGYPVVIVTDENE